MVCQNLASNPHINRKKTAGSARHAGISGMPTGTAAPPVGQELATVAQSPYLPSLEKYFPPPLPLELDSSSESLTENKTDYNCLYYRPLQNDYLRFGLSEKGHRELLSKLETDNFDVGACLNVFKSGEITGGCYSMGRKSAPGQRGKIISKEFSKNARKTIRRAVESKVTNFKLFITLTFDPKISTLNESGQVDHAWAKKEFIRFLNTVKKRYDRMADKTGKEHWRISYLWVAEIQEKHTHNVHFHIMVDRQFIDVKWLVKIWGQAVNSVNVKKLNNQEHAANYMLKYMKKGNCPIAGKRYGMTQNLVKGSKPALRIRFDGRGKRDGFKDVLKCLTWEIEQNGGHVIEWGFHIPPPKRQSVWIDKLGKRHDKKSTSSKIGIKVMKQLKKSMDKIESLLSTVAEIENNEDKRANSDYVTAWEDDDGFYPF
jgi:hypothetical protein